MSIRNLFAGLVVLVVVSGCATGGYNGYYGGSNRPLVSTGGAIAGSLALGTAAVVGSIFGNKTNEAAIGAWERTENERVLAYKELNARCALGGDGTVRVSGENSGTLQVSGTNSGTQNCPTSVLPYPQPAGNTSFHQISGGQQVSTVSTQYGTRQLSQPAVWSAGGSNGWQPSWNGLDCTKIPAGSGDFVRCQRAAGLIQ